MPDIPSAKLLPPKLVRNARLLAHRTEILPLLPKNAVVAEVGVALGDYSEEFFRKCDVKHFIAIDLFDLEKYPGMWHGRVGKELAGLSHIEYYRKRFADHIQSGKMLTLVGPSVESLETLQDRSVDVFYVDANHSYAAVSAELAAIRRKITPDGIIVMNDYTMYDYVTGTPYGVIQATNEFMIEHDWELIYFALHSGMYCDVAIRKRL